MQYNVDTSAHKKVSHFREKVCCDISQMTEGSICQTRTLTGSDSDDTSATNTKLNEKNEISAHFCGLHVCHVIVSLLRFLSAQDNTGSLSLGAKQGSMSFLHACFQFCSLMRFDDDRFWKSTPRFKSCMVMM